MKQTLAILLAVTLMLGCIPAFGVSAEAVSGTAQTVNDQIDRYLTQIGRYNDCDNEVVDGTVLVSYRNASALTMEMETTNVTQGTAAAKFIKKRANDDDLPMLFRTMDTLEISDYTAISFDVYVSENMTVLGKTADSTAWANVRFQADHVDSMDTGWIVHIDWPEKISNLKAGEWVTITLDIPADQTGTFRQISIRPGNKCFTGAANDYLLVDNVRLTPKEETILAWSCAGAEDAVLELKAMYDALSDTEKAKVTYANYLTAWAQTAKEVQGPAIAELIKQIDTLAAQFGTGVMFNNCDNQTSGGTEIIANTNSGAWSFGMVTDNLTEGTSAAKYAKKSAADADLPMIVRGDNSFTTTDYKAVNFDLYISEGMTVTGTSSAAWAVMKLQTAWDNSSDAGAVCEVSFKGKIPTLKAGQWNAVSIPLPETMNTNAFKQICIRIGYECLGGAVGDYVIIDNVTLAYSDRKLGSFAVGSGKEDEIKAMKATYDDLTDAQKEAVTNVSLLNCWLNAIVEAEATLADEVIRLIDAIGTVHIFSDDAIRLARETYNKLSAAKKEEVTNYQVLLDAEAALAQMEATGSSVVPEEMQTKPAANAAGQVLSDCNSAAQATITGADKVVYPTVNGETFVAFTVTAGELLQLRGLHLGSSPVSVTGKSKDDLSLRMAIYISNGKGLRSGGQFEITSGHGPDQNELHWMSEGVTLKDGWNVLYLDLKDAQATGGELDLSDINYLRFYLYGTEDLTMAFDDIALVDRVVPDLNEDFSDASAADKWQSEATVSVKEQALQVQGNGTLSVQTNAYDVAITQPAYTPIEFDLQVASPEKVTAMTFTLTDQNGKKATLALEPAKLSADKAAHYMVVPIDMTCQAGFAFDLTTTAALTVESEGDNTLILDNVTTNVRNGLYWRDWVYNYTTTPGDFSIAVIPDIQELTAVYPDKLNTVMQWLVDNKEKENLQFAIDVGDVTWNGHSGNAGEFAAAADAFNKLEEAGIEYSIAYGNHDYQSGRDTSLLNQYFPLSELGAFDSYGGVMTEGKIDNMYYTFTVQGVPFMIVSLEFDPLPDTVAWANRVIAEHPNYNVIIVTHNYMNDVYGQYSYAGENLWPNLASKHQNIRMVICGHDCLAEDPGSLSYRVDNGENGNTVHQLMVNSQDIDAARGGVGLLLMMRFRDGGKTIDLNYFSPVNDNLAYKEQNQFTITIPADELIVDAQAAVDAIIERIDALPEADQITYDNMDAIAEEIMAIDQAIMALPDEQQQRVTNIDKLVNRTEVINRLYDNKIAAQHVMDKINALTGEDSDAIVDARMAYEQLTEEQKALVTNLDKLEALENPAVTVVYGDVNGDDSIDAKDALLILQAAVDKAELTEEQTKKADVNGDTAIDAKDALLVLQKAVDKIDQFPVEK